MARSRVIVFFISITSTCRTSKRSAGFRKGLSQSPCQMQPSLKSLEEM